MVKISNEKLKKKVFIRFATRRLILVRFLKMAKVAEIISL